jgi:hypothetical protein
MMKLKMKRCDSVTPRSPEPDETPTERYLRTQLYLHTRSRARHVRGGLCLSARLAAALVCSTAHGARWIGLVVPVS